MQPIGIGIYYTLSSLSQSYSESTIFLFLLYMIQCQTRAFEVDPRLESSLFRICMAFCITIWMLKPISDGVKFGIYKYLKGFEPSFGK